MDFAAVKPAGMPAEKHTLNKYSFWCTDCNDTWVSDPQSQRDYLDYVWLREKTTMITNDMNKVGNIRISPMIDPNELIRCSDLADKILSSYRNILPLPMDEWVRIEEGAR